MFSFFPDFSFSYGFFFCCFLFFFFFFFGVSSSLPDLFFLMCANEFSGSK